MTQFRQDIILDSRQSFARPHLAWQKILAIFSSDYPACRIVAASVVLTMILLLNSQPLAAGMFVCRDSSGALNFTNVRNSSDCKAFVLKKAGSWKGMVKGPDSAKYDSEIRRIGRLYQVDPSLIKAIIHIESDFNHRAVSRCGAQGLMQLMPGTARELRVSDPFNARENIDGGTRYFRSLLDSFNEDLVLSLAAYNAGPGLVARLGRVPKIPETQRYVKKVLKRYKVYRKTF